MSLSSAPNRLVYLAFGSETYHQEAFFSIVSALARLEKTTSPTISIHVFSDREHIYDELPVTVHIISAEQLSEWARPIDYHFRAKHVLLRHVLGTCEKAVLIDTDTFFRKSPKALFERVAPGTLLCNAIGPCFGEDRSGLLYETLAGPLQREGLAGNDMRMTNSGVIGLCHSEADLLEHSIALMDNYRALSPKAYTLEEFMLAVAAHKKGLRLSDCTDVIHHYWSRKRLFRAKVCAWYAKHKEEPLGQAALADIDSVSDKLPRPPSFQRLIYKFKTRSLMPEQRQFARELLYGCYSYPNEFDRACGSAWWEKAFENAYERSLSGVPQATILKWLDEPALRKALGEKNVAKVKKHLGTVNK
ncbi:hypothetical protein GCM10009425_05790 [Pseudomonas asuensis]|uniref:Nucleotide-diphospho-sugar transferase n=1 Tax=Pseudomonas asuensis TaxID=1825787 RepID=A0ABQ2GIV3_9PSED|nr:hypothetical protein [Pseudomonas asuensis]GGL97510.1 hypothetical protein GCM10009425_05790 [Pseudomonas asuensis]